MVGTEELQRTVFSRVPKETKTKQNKQTPQKKEKKKKSREPPCTKLIGFFLCVCVCLCVCMFNISPSVAVVSPPRSLHN